MNNKGFITSGLLIVILLVSGMIISIFYTPLLNSTYSIKNSFNYLDENINVKNSLERIHIHLYNNIAYKGLLDYDDLGLKYELSDMEVNYRTVNTDSNTFKIINPTNIEIKLYFTEDEPIDEYDIVDGYYKVSLKNKNEVLFKDVFTNDETITIDSSYFNDIDNFGEYELKIDSYDGYTSHNITDEELSYRKIELTEEQNKENKKYIIIENRTSIDDTFKMYISES